MTACTECSRLASRVEELEKKIAQINVAYEEMHEYGLMTGWGGVERSFSIATEYLKKFEEALAKHSLSPEISSTQLDTTKEKI